MSSASEADKVWLAAMIDGEGSFGTLRTGRDGTSLGLRISITNSDWRIIEHAKQVWNRITGERVVAQPHAHKHMWELRVCSKTGIKQTITAVARYLVGKKAQAAFMFVLASRVWERTKDKTTPPWVWEVADKIRWHNRHWCSPDGKMVPTGKEKTRQLRRPGGNLLSETQETACGRANIAQGTVQAT